MTTETKVQYRVKVNPTIRWDIHATLDTQEEAEEMASDAQARGLAVRIEKVTTTTEFIKEYENQKS